MYASEDNADTLEDRLLGTFQRTHIRRTPEIGEYYLCERTMGIAQATQAKGAVREILRRVVPKPIAK